MRLVIALVAVVAVVAGAVVFLVMRAIPDYRTALLVDASATTTSEAAGGFGAIRDSVGAAAQNAGDGDALSLRRFGGACGDPGNTAELVGSGTGRGERIRQALRELEPAGKATLRSGILAAIDDFSGRFPFRGSERNRIVVVTGSGVDACSGDPAAVAEEVRGRVAEAGLSLDFRFVGFGVPDAQRETLGRIAAAGKAPEPRFADSAEDLTAILRELTIPDAPEAQQVHMPSQETFRPLAWTTDSQIKILRDPGKPALTLSMSDGNSRPGTVIWSADRGQVAWTEISRDPNASARVGMLDLTSGAKHAWTCEFCEIAFLGERLVSSGQDLTVYPADGGAPTQVDIQGIPPGLAQDSAPNTQPFSIRRDDGTLATYATVTEDSRPPDASGISVGIVGLYEITPNLGARRLAGQTYDLVREFPGFLSVSPDGKRAMFWLGHFGGGTFSACTVSHQIRVIDLTTGKTTAAATRPQFGLKESAAWFDSDGTAHAVFENWGSALGGPQSCERNIDTPPLSYRLPASGNTWVKEKGAAGRTVKVGGSAQVRDEAVGGAPGRLILEDGNNSRTLDDKVRDFYPSW
ncbi:MULTISPECIES: hypothetical protein [unclassified Streptomyces]|uniref:hypothetical protein n=1 Tax=unclassified Streptomyces TaxID=2593676 RepID=UPI001F03B6B1|nr:MULTISPECIES: hypothetical protein [unclassified Streptomyces]MCH0565901.1 hypothetical protein [Streptomyces sp. MUM 2J]MCH0569066.1 hypothetical protein [Streptomyces sp. MUM 136J]